MSAGLMSKITRFAESYMRGFGVRDPVDGLCCKAKRAGLERASMKDGRRFTAASLDSKGRFGALQQMHSSFADRKAGPNARNLPMSGPDDGKYTILDIKRFKVLSALLDQGVPTGI